MPKQSTAKNSENSGNGIMGSGIFGMFGTTIQCPASDTSMYCSFMKMFNLVMIIGFILFILYTIYIMFIAPSLNKRR